MKFNNLHANTDCDCLKNAEENYTDTFARRINKSQLSEKDFKSHWELGKSDNSNDCEKKCLVRGVSINKYTTGSHKQIIEKYKHTVRFKPYGHSKKCICLFKFKEDCGKVKRTSTKSDSSHYTLFKCDSFSINNLEVIKTEPLINYVQNI